VHCRSVHRPVASAQPPQPIAVMAASGTGGLASATSHPNGYYPCCLSQLVTVQCSDCSTHLGPLHITASSGLGSIKPATRGYTNSTTATTAPSLQHSSGSCCQHSKPHPQPHGRAVSLSTATITPNDPVCCCWLHRMRPGQLCNIIVHSTANRGVFSTAAESWSHQLT
jgi:hypothetical protein